MLRGRCRRPGAAARSVRFRTERNDRAPAFYLYDAKELSAKQIGSAYPALDAAALPRREPYTYIARDGTPIPAYLTRPLGADGPTPLVVLPHGGPAARDVGGFDWLAHFVASRDFSNLRRGGFSTTVSYWQRAMGVTPGSDANERLRAASPAYHAESVSAPVLLIHGLDDSVVPFEQSRIMEQALRDADKTVQLVTLEGEDHWLSVAPTRLETLRALERFLAQHLAD